jgi:hypothetical protein
MWPEAVPVFRYLRFVPDQEPASLQLTEIVSAGSIDFNPMKAPDVAPIAGPEIVTLSVAEEGTAPCPQPAHYCVSLFAHRRTLGHGGDRSSQFGPLNNLSKLPRHARLRRAATPALGTGRFLQALAVDMQTFLKSCRSHGLLAAGLLATFRTADLLTLVHSLRIHRFLAGAAWASAADRRSNSALSLAPTSTTIVDTHIQVIKPIIAPSEP